jgi:hypothetical protein
MRWDHRVTGDETQLHQPPGIVFGQVQTVENSGFSTLEFR